MPEQIITFVKGDKISDETDYRDQLPVNMSPIFRPMFGADGYMLEWPGLTSFGTASGISRGGVWNERVERHYRISGNEFGEVSSGGVFTKLGDVPGGDVASLPYSFETQAIIADGKFYLYDPVNGFRQVTDPEGRTPIRS